MEMSWDKLANRCQLFVDTNKGMLIELLKEAEEELARECKIFEDSVTYSTPLPSSTNEQGTVDEGTYCLLPQACNSVQSVYHNGNRLSPMDESSLDLDSTNNPAEGNPSFYYIKKSDLGWRLMFDTKPTTGVIRVEYISLIPNYNASKIYRASPGGTNQFTIKTNLNAELDGLTGEGDDGGFTAITFDSALSWGSKFTCSGAGSIPTNSMVEIYNYRSIAPIIPGQYHKDLCDYAIAIASAKANPEMHNKHLSLWLNNIEKIKNEDADRELIHQIRSEI